MLVSRMPNIGSDFKRVAAIGSIVLAVTFSLAACDVHKEAEPQSDSTINIKKSQIPVLESQHCLYGCPVANEQTDNRVIERSIYVLSNNRTTKFADWVAYSVKKENIGTIETRNFVSDPDLPANETLKVTDYINARDDGLDYDRGHQAPLKTLSGNKDWEQANYLGNITPQKKELNEGPWLQLENRERNIALCNSKVRKQDRNLAICATQGSTELYVQTGTLYEQEMAKLPHAKRNHTVPSGYWKIVAVIENGELKTGAFIMNQDMHRSDRYCKTAVPISEIEKRTSYKFFPLYPKGENFKTRPGPLMFNLGC